MYIKHGLLWIWLFIIIVNIYRFIYRYVNFNYEIYLQSHILSIGIYLKLLSTIEEYVDITAEMSDRLRRDIELVTCSESSFSQASCSWLVLLDTPAYLMLKPSRSRFADSISSCSRVHSAVYERSWRTYDLRSAVGKWQRRFTMLCEHYEKYTNTYY